VLVATTLNVKLVPGTAIMLAGCWIIMIGTCAVNVALRLIPTALSVRLVASRNPFKKFCCRQKSVGMFYSFIEFLPLTV